MGVGTLLHCRIEDGGTRGTVLTERSMGGGYVVVLSDVSDGKGYDSGMSYGRTTIVLFRIEFGGPVKKNTFWNNDRQRRKNIANINFAHVATKRVPRAKSTATTGTSSLSCASQQHSPRTQAHKTGKAATPALGNVETRYSLREKTPTHERRRDTSHTLFNSTLPAKT